MADSSTAVVHTYVVGELACYSYGGARLTRAFDLAITSPRTSRDFVTGGIIESPDIFRKIHDVIDDFFTHRHAGDFQGLFVALDCMLERASLNGFSICTCETCSAEVENLKSFLLDFFIVTCLGDCHTVERWWGLLDFLDWRSSPP